MKKAIAVTLISLLGIFNLAAQSTGTVEGRYDLVSMTNIEDGVEIDYWEVIKELYAMAGEGIPDHYIEFLNGGIVKLVTPDESSEGTFKQNGNTLTITMNDITYTVAIEGNRIIFEINNGKMIYEKK